MRKIKFITLLSILTLLIFSCARHDFIDEMSITGEVGPQAIWELSSSSVAAGTDAGFVLQYYSTVDDISHSEAWYSVTEVLSKKVTCPWVNTFVYSVASETTELKRISEKIKSYPHTQAVWSDSLSAFVIEDGFPVTGTLASFSWKQPEQFDEKDSLNMKKYFGENFMEHFKDSLYGLMQYADFNRMINGLNLDDMLMDRYGGKSFKELTDSTWDSNSASWVYHFLKLEDGSTPVPNGVKELYQNEISFDKLIQTPAGYDVEYSRSYKIDALVRVFDTRGIYGNTVIKTIEIN